MSEIMVSNGMRCRLGLVDIARSSLIWLLWSSVLGSVEFEAVHILFRHRVAASSGSGAVAVMFPVLALMILLVV